MRKFVSPYGATPRRNFVLLLLGVFATGVFGRIVYLQTSKAEDIIIRANDLFTRTVKEPASRGTIVDRNNVPLAVSTQVSSLWVNPHQFETSPDAMHKLANALGMPLERLQGRLRKSYDDWLSGTAGSSKISRSVGGKVFEILEEIKPPVQGNDLKLTIDQRLQYLTYMALLETAEKFSARTATAVMLDAKTSEILAMVSVPSGNPNNTQERRKSLLENRAVTNVFEPGSVMKVFAVATALDAGLVGPYTPINTSPGYFKVHKNVVKDIHNYGKLNVSTVIKKSSNVGTCKIALRLPKVKLQAMYEALGLGQKSQIDFPGESKGIMHNMRRMNEFDYCTNAYGYGISVTALQLAEAYAVIANDGIRIPATLEKYDSTPEGTRVMSKRTAKQVRNMLRLAVSEGGTGKSATKDDYMADYTVGGKTGTVHKAIKGGYAKKRYRAIFAGMAPLNDPRVVMVVMIDEPKGKKYYGGQVAAPVFAKVVGKALRMMGVTPDKKGAKRRGRVIHAKHNH